MLKRFVIAAATAMLVTQPALAAPQPGPTIELTAMSGRWCVVAHVPNIIQNGFEAGVSEWNPSGEDFSMVQTCRRGSPDGPLARWKGRATVADTETNAKFKMSFFGSVVRQEYWVLDHRPGQGRLILTTAYGKYLWLTSQEPVLLAGIQAEAVSRIR